MKQFAIKNIKGLVILLAVAGLILFNVHLYKKAAENEKKAEVAEYNLKVATDTIRVIKDRQGKVEYDRYAYLAKSVKDLAKVNEELALQVKQIKGNVTTVIEGQVKIVEKPVPFVVKAELLDSNIVAHFKYDTVYSAGNYRKFSGSTSYDLKTGKVTADKEQDETGIKFVTGIKNLDKGKPEIFLKSDYPGFSVTSLEGANLNPELFKPKHKTPLITPTLSVGWTPVTFSTTSQSLKIDPKDVGVTLGLGFNLFKILGVKK